MIKRIALALGLGVFLMGTAAYAGVPPDAICKDKKAKETGKKVLGKLKAFGKNQKAPNVSKLNSDLSKANSKFTKGFSKAEDPGAAPRTGTRTTSRPRLTPSSRTSPTSSFSDRQAARSSMGRADRSTNPAS